ncbi:hypothetical protein DFP93_10222 [Aneurinibacillus soli]|uniref:Uncharacterized protein n=1 Tax=Aneurinibacillus soli TaxID=1500254 RepID=A0A0U5C6K2_9BACL|nr:hypothetical protein DFP93_10222 [Aneurinibacillus soli]BAU27731.1 hypothetical protein CB4_01905 [Aneurinibacillus soli]
MARNIESSIERGAGIFWRIEQLWWWKSRREKPFAWVRLAEKFRLAAPGARRTRPQRKPPMFFHRRIAGKGPFAVLPPLGNKRTVALLLLSSLLPTKLGFKKTNPACKTQAEFIFKPCLTVNLSKLGQEWRRKEPRNACTRYPAEGAGRTGFCP